MTLTPVQALQIDEAYVRDYYRPTDAQVERVYADLGTAPPAFTPTQTVLLQARRIIDACRSHATAAAAVVAARREDRDAEDPERWDGLG